MVTTLTITDTSYQEVLMILLEVTLARWTVVITVMRQAPRAGFLKRFVESLVMFSQVGVVRYSASKARGIASAG